MSNEKSLKRAITTTNLQLEKPLITDYYDVNIFNRNMDKVDEAYSEIMSSVSGLELKAEKVSIADSTNKFEATNVEEALLENKTSILELQAELGANKSTLEANINSIREVL
uniref:Uncharacterized protein n=1 Tax=Siphoviridae sp. ctcx61 TaxID=2825575 RepID=A0A8S5TWN4_9CAUD|nr:MAG TPA: hypothetical protein [Siphoviridae sp. ctcx61]